MTTRLYKWAIVALFATTGSNAFATSLDGACSVSTVLGGNAIQFSHPGFNVQLPTDGSGFPVPGGSGGTINVCYHSSIPTLAQTIACDITTTEGSGTNFASVYDSTTDTSCIFTYNVAAGTNVRSAPAVIAQAAIQAVPIFSPFGLFALLSGLFLYGKRRKVISKKV